MLFIHLLFFVSSEKCLHFSYQQLEREIFLYKQMYYFFFEKVLIFLFMDGNCCEIQLNKYLKWKWTKFSGKSFESIPLLTLKLQGKKLCKYI